MNELRDRCERALEELKNLRYRAAALHNQFEYARLTGKVEGVQLVLDYMRAYEPADSDEGDEWLEGMLRTGHAGEV